MSALGHNLDKKLINIMLQLIKIILLLLKIAKPLAFWAGDANLSFAQGLFV